MEGIKSELKVPSTGGVAGRPGWVAPKPAPEVPYCAAKPVVALA